MHWHPTLFDELPVCLAINPSSAGSEIVGRERCLSTWQALLGERAFVGLTVEAIPPAHGHRIVGFGGGVFVNDEFVDREVGEPKPGVSARFIASFAAGHSVALTEGEIKQANTFEGLNILFFGGHVREDILTESETREAQNQLWLACLQAYRGYRLRRAIREAVDAKDVEYMRAYRTGAVVMFDDFFRQNPDSSWNRDRALMVSAREDEFKVPGSVPALLYEFREPVLGLTAAHQRLLETALSGLTDEQLADRLAVTLPAIKKRWASAFERVATVRPDILADGVGHLNRESRGPQKRHRLLAYVRDHPEELRPWLGSARRPIAARVPCHSRASERISRR